MRQSQALPALLATCLALQAGSASADGFVMGSGRWTCEQVLQVLEKGEPIEQGQFYGWVLGAWSLATLRREEGFIDKVENAGGRKIVEVTIAECKKAPGDTELFKVVDTMIRNTK